MEWVKGTYTNTGKMYLGIDLTVGPQHQVSIAQVETGWATREEPKTEKLIRVWVKQI